MTSTATATGIPVPITVLARFKFWILSEKRRDTTNDAPVAIKGVNLRPLSGNIWERDLADTKINNAVFIYPISTQIDTCKASRRWNMDICYRRQSIEGKRLGNPQLSQNTYYKH